VVIFLGEQPDSFDPSTDQFCFVNRDPLESSDAARDGTTSDCRNKYKPQTRRRCHQRGVPHFSRKFLVVSGPQESADSVSSSSEALVFLRHNQDGTSYCVANAIVRKHGR